MNISRIERVIRRWGDRFVTEYLRLLKRSSVTGGCLRFLHLHSVSPQKRPFQRPWVWGCGRGLKWRDIEVFHDPNGKPGLRLHGKSSDICRKAGITGIHLSLSDDSEYGVAVVVLEKRDAGMGLR